MVVIDSEFESLIPPLSEDEYKRLEGSITTEGYHDWEPIVTWNGTIIDGHNRYHICDEHGIEFVTREMQFESRDAAKIWIINHQIGRRNLNDAQRMDVVRKLKASIEAEMKRKQQESGKQYGRGQEKVSPKSDEPISHERTDVIMARMADVGKGKMREYDEIATKAEEGDQVAIQERDALLSGKRKSVHGAYVNVVGKKPPRKKEDRVTEDGRKICSMCGEPISEGDEAKDWSGAHASCVYEYQRDRWHERSDKRKAAFTDDGRRICSFCGEPIDEGKHYQDKLNWCYECGLAHATDMQRKYRDADYDLRNNVAVYTIKSLTTELTGSVEMMRSSIEQSIHINESMGVRISDEQKEKLNGAIASVFEVIQDIRDSE